MVETRILPCSPPKRPFGDSLLFDLIFIVLTSAKETAWFKQVGCLADGHISLAKIIGDVK